MATYFDTHALKARLESVLVGRFKRIDVALDEVQIVVTASDYASVALALRDADGLRFEQLLDLCGIDYSDYRDGQWDGPRYAVACQLMSVSLNHRVRLKTFCTDDDFPVIATLTDVWSSAEWYEREAFDLFGIVFEGHKDLRRILTDYGFIGHPFRKDFPVSGHVEMRYDAERKRVIYQPVTIEPREIIPRVIREDDYGAGLAPRGVK
jgi:NADH-quinone oxidoreductase subunit C